MSQVELLTRARDKMDELIRVTAEEGVLSRDAIALAVRLIVPAAKILRADVAIIRSCSSDEQLQRVVSAAERSGDMALAHAIVGDDV